MYVYVYMYANFAVESKWKQVLCDMKVYMLTNAYVYMCMYTRVYMCMYVGVCLYVRVCMYVHTLCR